MSTTTVNAHSNVHALIFLQDGRHFLSGSEDGRIRQWRINDGVEVGEAMNTGGYIAAMALSPDGNWIVCTGLRVATVWNMRTHQRTLTIKEHSPNVNPVDVSPDSSRFATGADDRKVFIWDILTGKRLVGPLQHDDVLLGVKFSPNGDRIATGDLGTLRIYNAVCGELLETFHVGITSWPTTAPGSIWWYNAQSIFAISLNTCFHLDANTGQTLSNWTLPGAPVNHLTSIALASNNRFIASHVGDSISLWDPSTSARISAVIKNPTTAFSLAISPDNTYLASSIAGVVTIRNLHSIIPAYYLDDQQPPESGTDLRLQVQALHDKLYALQSHLGTPRKADLHLTDSQAKQDDMRSPFTNIQSSNPPHTQTPPCTPDGAYRIKSNVGNLYLTRPHDGASTVVVQPLSRSNNSQIWSVSLANGTNGAYHIMGESDVLLTVGIRDALVIGSRGITTWNFDPRGNAYTIGNAVNVMAIQLAQNRQRVLVFPRDNNPNQLWVLEPVTI